MEPREPQQSLMPLIGLLSKIPTASDNGTNYFTAAYPVDRSFDPERAAAKYSAARL